MASQESPPPPSTPPPLRTTVFSLGADLLRQIFLRLPSLPSLFRAAFACRTFRDAVRSDPNFRRDFRARRPPPLLGLFLDHEGATMPYFVPIRSADRDLAAVVRGADFFFTRLPDQDPASPQWAITDRREGLILLVRGDTGESGVYNPLMGNLDITPVLPDELYHELESRGPGYLDCFILPSQEAGGPPRLFHTWQRQSELRAMVFSCDSREWQIFPWSESVAPQVTESGRWLKVEGGTMVNGFAYWQHTDEAYMLVLNTATQEFSQMRLPDWLEGSGDTYMIGETKNGQLCIVSPDGFALYVWVRRANADGIDNWVLDNRFKMEKIVKVTKGTLEEHRELTLVAIIDGFVYFCTGETFDDPLSPAWFLSMCMETGEVDKLFQKKLEIDIHPYVMAWPPGLLPQLEGA